MKSRSATLEKDGSTMEEAHENKDDLEGKRLSFRCTNVLKAGHGKPVFCVSFNNCDLFYRNVFAAAGSNQVEIYECLKGGDVEMLHAYRDPNPEESFYVCAWSIDLQTSAPLLIFAGVSGVIRMVDCREERLIHNFIGHGNSVNDLKVSPHDPELLLSASKDESIRLWNIRTRVCVLIFAGSNGHRYEVLSVDFHPWDKHKFVSCGMDRSIRIWSMERAHGTVSKAKDWKKPPSTFPTRVVEQPIFYTTRVHANYVDCVKWIGDIILSKSVENRVVMWKPDIVGRSSKKDGVDLLQDCEVADCDLWFMRFSMDFYCKWVAVGNRFGRVNLLDMRTVPIKQVAKLTSPDSKGVIRQTAVNYNGTIVLACGDEGAIIRWDR